MSTPPQPAAAARSPLPSIQDQLTHWWQIRTDRLLQKRTPLLDGGLARPAAWAPFNPELTGHILSIDEARRTARVQWFLGNDRIMQGEPHGPQIEVLLDFLVPGSHSCYPSEVTIG